MQVIPFRRNHVVTTVSNTKINTSVGAKREPMHVVPTKCYPDTISAVQCFLDVSNSIAISVFQQPQIRNACVVDISIDCQNACTCSVFNLIKSIGKSNHLVGERIVIRINKQSYAIFKRRIVMHFFTKMFTKHCQPIGNTLRCKIIFKPYEMFPIIFDSFALAKCFTDKHLPHLVN